MRLSVNVFCRRVGGFIDPTVYQEIKYLGSPRTNCKYVTLKSDRTCNGCRTKLSRGSKSLTVNKKYKGRVWYCLPCGWDILPSEGIYEVGKLMSGEVVGVEWEGIYKPLSYFNFEDKLIYEDIEYTKLEECLYGDV